MRNTILPPAMFIAAILIPALPVVSDAVELLTYETPQSTVQSNREAFNAAADVALSAASALGIDLEGATMCDEVAS